MMILNDIDYKSLEVDGIDTKDWPDFCDAYFSAGNYVDGTPLPEDVLKALSEDGERVNAAVFDLLF